MRCSYACGSVDHEISRRSFLGTAAAGLGLASGFSGLIRPAVSAELARRERQVLLIWLAGGASQLETWDPKPGTDTGGPFRSIETSRARRAHLGTHAINRQTNASDGAGARGQHQGRRPRQGPVSDADRAPRDAGPGVSALGLGGRQYLAAEENPLPGFVHIQPGGGGLAGVKRRFSAPSMARSFWETARPRPTPRGPARSAMPVPSGAKRCGTT